MYRHCIYCSADLGTNETLEAFPVGRTVAFDAAKGRLWAVCRRCARWNLAPLEERWEAVEEAERVFSGTSLRAQRENVGLARLRDGTRLVRAGAALPGEMAVWRYGEALVRRRWTYLAGTSGLIAAGVAAVVLKPFIAAMPLYAGVHFIWSGVREREQRNVVVHRFRGGDLPFGAALELRGRAVVGATLAIPERGDGFDLQVSWSTMALGEGEDGKPAWIRYDGFRLVGHDARNGLGRGFVWVNAAGGSRRNVDAALEMLSAAPDAAAYLRRAAETGQPIHGGRGPARRPRALALEMALHADSERRALDGELALLESAWREAEEIAAIADRLAVAGTVPQPA